MKKPMLALLLALASVVGLSLMALAPTLEAQAADSYEVPPGCEGTQE
ncbi:MAG: hypothetical protein ACK41F_12575 [Fimbriimonadaceae bacterium]